MSSYYDAFGATSGPPAKQYNEYGGVRLGDERTSVIIDQRVRVWNRCKQCHYHYCSEDWPLQCPQCQLPYGANPKLDVIDSLDWSDLNDEAPDINIVTGEVEE